MSDHPSHVFTGTHPVLLSPVCVNCKASPNSITAGVSCAGASTRMSSPAPSTRQHVWSGQKCLDCGAAYGPASFGPGCPGLPATVKGHRGTYQTLSTRSYFVCVDCGVQHSFSEWKDSCGTHSWHLLSLPGPTHGVYDCARCSAQMAGHSLLEGCPGAPTTGVQGPKPTAAARFAYASALLGAAYGVTSNWTPAALEATARYEAYFYREENGRIYNRLDRDPAVSNSLYEAAILAGANDGLDWEVEPEVVKRRDELWAAQHDWEDVPNSNSVRCLRCKTIVVHTKRFHPDNMNCGSAVRISLSPRCTVCSTELSAYLDVCYDRDPEVAKRCRKCRGGKA